MTKSEFFENEELFETYRETITITSTMAPSLHRKWMPFVVMQAMYKEFTTADTYMGFYIETWNSFKEEEGID